MVVSLYLMVGASGSGKSTWALRHQEEMDAEIVSTDEIRGELFGDESDQTHNAAVFATAYERTRNLLEGGHSVIFDATNLTAARRLDVIERVKPRDKDHYLIVYYVFMDTTYEECIANQMRRDRQVPMEVIHRQFQQLQPLKPTEWALEIHEPQKT